MKIKINDENVGYFSIYRSFEDTYIELNKNRPSFTDSEIERGLNGTFEEYCTTNKKCFGVAFACIDNSNDNIVSTNYPQGFR